MNTTKVCSKCKISKDGSEFTPRLDRVGALYSSCKACKNAYSGKRYKTRRLEDPIKLWCYNVKNWAKDRAKRQGVLFELTLEDVTTALATTGSAPCCTYCKKAFNFRRTIATRRDSPTLDRIIPDKGYTSQNVVVCCYRCNMIKNEASPEELQQLAEAVVRLAKERQLYPVTLALLPSCSA